MNKQELFLLLQANTKLDNKKAFSVASLIEVKLRAWHKGEVKEAVAKAVAKEVAKEVAKAPRAPAQTAAMTDEERADALACLLDDKLRTGDITAAELAQLKDIFNLKQKDRDIVIEVISYADWEGDKRVDNTTNN